VIVTIFGAKLSKPKISHTLTLHSIYDSTE
jgi:hypothetical protein